jgi:tryptophan-rich hypothetical protein
VKKPKYPFLMGSRWTAKESTFGWRHFEVVSRKNEDGIVFAELVSSCDPSVRFWLNTKTLRDRQLWYPGWKSLAEQGHPPQETKM